MELILVLDYPRPTRVGTLLYCAEDLSSRPRGPFKRMTAQFRVNQCDLVADRMVGLTYITTETLLELGLRVLAQYPRTLPFRH